MASDALNDFRLFLCAPTLKTERKRKSVKRVKFKKVAKRRPKEIPVMTYVISSLFLMECYDYLMSNGWDENLCYVTGIPDESGNARYLSKMLTPRLSHRSPVGAVADDRAVFESMDLLDNYGHGVEGLFHEHPGDSPPWPSSIDVRTHGAHERMYGSVLGAIFVKSGYVRFFSVDVPFKIRIYGKKVRRIKNETNLFRLEIA